jgi:hypothetical protein
MRSKPRHFLAFLPILFFLLPPVLQAQNSFIARWQQRATAIQAQQPHWVTPLVTVTPRLEQEFRSDFVRQFTPAGTTTWNYGNGKGLELIPFKPVELIFNVPPYIQHNSSAHDGFGDTTFLLKYRIVSANEEQGNYIVTAFVGGSVPTGSYKNGSVAATVTPTLALGKGFGKFDIVSTAGAALPASNTTAVGRPVSWNTTAQLKLGKYLWPEIENNSTFFEGGPNDGKMQNFITPGLLLGRFHLSKAHPRLGATFGFGEQIATSHFHTYNHGLVFTGRIPF